MPVDMPRNAFKARLRSGPAQIGFWSTFGSPIATEILGNSGVDWIILDTEHGPADPLTTLFQLQALNGGSAAACVRVAANDPVLIKKALDIGAQTIIIPQIDSVEDARQAIAPTLFPPKGTRGVSTTARAGRYGAVANYQTQADTETCAIIMIESGRALDALPEIVAVEGVEAILFGPQDFAADLGFLMQPGSTNVVAAIEKGINIILEAGKFPGVAVGSEADASRWIARGARFVTCGSDVSLLARGAEALAQRLVKAAKPA